MPRVMVSRNNLMCYSLVKERYNFIYVDRRFSYRYDEVDPRSVLFVNEDLIQISETHYDNPKYIESLLIYSNPKVLLVNGMILPALLNLELLAKA